MLILLYVSSSKDKVNGFSIEDILKRGSYSKDSTWQKHYCNFVVTNPELFQDSTDLGIRFSTEKMRSL